MMSMRIAQFIALLCISGSLHSGRGPKKHMKRLQLHSQQLRTKKHYNEVKSEALAKKAGSSKIERFRKMLLQDAHWIIARNADTHKQCSNSIVQLKRSCSPSIGHAKKLIHFLNRPDALVNEPLSPQASSWDNATYNSAKAGCLLPLLVHAQLLLIPNNSAISDTDIFSDTLKAFDIFARTAQKDLMDLREKLLQQQQRRINEKLLTLSQLLHNAQAQSKRMQEALESVRLTYEAQHASPTKNYNSENPFVKEYFS